MWWGEVMVGENEQFERNQSSSLLASFVFIWRVTEAFCFNSLRKVTYGCVLEGRAWEEVQELSTGAFELII